LINPQVSPGTGIAAFDWRALAVPLITQGKLIGWLSIGPFLSNQEYTPDDSLLIARLALRLHRQVLPSWLRKNRLKHWRKNACSKK
jgi:hypothetical protein